MRKVELLAPAGTMDALKAAVQNGCDAVYVGGTMFGARAFAGNFDREEMQEAIAYTHLYGVKLYVTMNTLIYEDEMDDAYAYAKFLYEAGVDALIIQDLGFFDRLRNQLPELELHASTQMHVHNLEGIRFLKEHGAHRIVLPRETSIEEITQFTKEDIEFEVFVHGALCISYSGQCMMSEALFQRSGNRGQCAQACRMKYQLLKQQHDKEVVVKTDGEYVLSPRDLNTLQKIPELIKAGISSFKIEGRMKRPEYVAQVVSLYRKAIDAYEQGRSWMVDATMQRDLELIFNRKFTLGHLFHQQGTALMNAYRPNHMGVVIGNVSKATQKKITITLQADVTQGDGIRILQTKEDHGFLLNKIYKNGLLVNEAKANEVIELDCSDFIEPGAIVVKTSDYKQLQALQKPIARKIPIQMEAKFHIGAPMMLTISDGVHIVQETSIQTIEMAKTSAMDEQRLREQLAKCKDTPFEITNMKIELEDACFISIKEVNQLRRNAFAALMEQRIQNATREEASAYVKKLPQTNVKLPPYLLIVHTEAQYQACIQQHVTPRYTTNPQMAKQYALAYYSGSIEKELDESNLACEVGKLATKGTYIVQPSLYASNAYTAAFLEEHGAQQIILPYEMSEERWKKLIEGYQQRYQGSLQFGLEVYGYRDYMVSEHCPIRTYEGGNKHCGLCRKTQYYLKDVKNQTYPLMGDEECRVHILSNQPYDEIDQIPFYRQQQLQVFQLRFRLEDEAQTLRVLQRFQRYFTE